MATHQLAKGLASLGRNGDTMLMHVNPIEVEGLKALGAMTGRKVSTNPDTGLPEAFDFLDFFTSLIPTGIGMLLGGPAGAAMGLKGSMATAAPIVGGMAAGSLIAGAKGEDPLMGGVMGGLGGFGGGNLAKTFGQMGAGKLATAGGAIPENAIAATPIDATQLSQQIGGANLTGAVAPGSAVATAPMTYTEGLGQIGSGMKTLAKDPFGAGYDAFKQAGGSAFDIAAPVGMAGLAGAQDYLYPEADPSLEEKRKEEENKYKDPVTGLLNLSQASPGLKLMATGGTVGSNQSTITGGGIQDLYGTNDQTTGTQQLSRDGYGIGRLEKLASAGSSAKAADTFYAAGGPIAFAEGGSSNINIPGYDGRPLNLNNFSSLNLNTGKSEGINSGVPAYGLAELLGDVFSKNGAEFRENNPKGMALSELMRNTKINIEAGGLNPKFITMPQMIDAIQARAVSQGKSAFGNYDTWKESKKRQGYMAKGGYLDGDGDGMSDSIPATIEGKQPARLADGEFVIPADVVSHLGNGSSKAGSKKLYAMLDRVRKARVGTTKQGKQIKPEKYMPA